MPLPFKLLTAFGAFLIAGHVGYHFTHAHHFVGLSWPAIAVGTVLVLGWGRSMWPALLIANLTLRWQQEVGLTFEALLFITADFAEIFVASSILAWRLSWQQGFYSIKQLQRVLLSGTVAPLVSAPISAFALGSMTSGHSTVVDFLSISAIMWLRSAAGFFALAPALLCWFKVPASPFGSNKREGFIVAAVVVVLGVLVFTNWFAPSTHPFWLALIPMAAVFWSAARCGTFLTTHLVFAVLTAASFAAHAESSLFREFAKGDVRNMTWLILDLFGLVAMSLAVLSSRLVAKNEEEKAMRERLELLVRHSPIAVVEWDLDFRVQVWNDKAAQLFGFTAEQAIGALGPDLLVPVSERVLVWKRWDSFLSEGGPSGHFSNHNLKSTGEIILCDWYGSLVRDDKQQICGVVCLVVNASEREVASLALRDSEQRLRNIADVLPQMICYYDDQLVRRFPNAAYQEAFGGLEDLGPAPLCELALAENLQSAVPHCQRALAGETVRLFEEILLSDGQMHSVDRILLPDFSADGAVCGFFSVATDITQYLRAQEQQLALEMQILQTQKLESLAKLAGRLAHEFNNRLFGIIGHADIAMHDLPSGHSGYGAMQKVVEIGREAADLCRQMLVFSGHGSGDKTPVDCGATVVEMRRLLELSLPAHMRLITNISQHLPKIRADAAQIRQALMNLVHNAVEASSGQRREVQIEVQVVQRSQVELTESFLVNDGADQTLLAFSVRDDGEGIASEDLPRIFDPFFTTRSAARGLGLAGVLGIVHGHGGALSVQSELGKGATITMFFPVLAQSGTPTSGVDESDS